MYVYVKGESKIKASKIVFRELPAEIKVVCQKKYSVVYIPDFSGIEVEAVITRFVVYW